MAQRPQCHPGLRAAAPGEPEPVEETEAEPETEAGTTEGDSPEEPADSED